MLRKYSAIAREHHWCYNCCQDIYPGEEYEGEVWAIRIRLENGRLWEYIKTECCHPDCEPPDDPDDDDEGDWEKEGQEPINQDPSNDKDEPFPVAA